MFFVSLMVVVSFNTLAYNLFITQPQLPKEYGYSSKFGCITVPFWQKGGFVYLSQRSSNGDRIC